MAPSSWWEVSTWHEFLPNLRIDVKGIYFFEALSKFFRRLAPPSPPINDKLVFIADHGMSIAAFRPRRGVVDDAPFPCIEVQDADVVEALRIEAAKQVQLLTELHYGGTLTGLRQYPTSLLLVKKHFQL